MRDRNKESQKEREAEKRETERNRSKRKGQQLEKIIIKTVQLAVIPSIPF